MGQEADLPMARRRVQERTEDEGPGLLESPERLGRVEARGWISSCPELQGKGQE